MPKGKKGVGFEKALKLKINYMRPLTCDTCENGIDNEGVLECHKFEGLAVFKVEDDHTCDNHGVLKVRKPRGPNKVKDGESKPKKKKKKKKKDRPEETPLI